MNSDLPDLHPRQLLRDLPDLISGREPVLSKANVQAYLRSHPEARSPLLLASSMVSVLQGAPSRLYDLPASVPREFWKPVDKARQMLAMELKDVLHEAALWHLVQATRAVGVYTHCDVPPQSPSPAALEKAYHQIACQLGDSIATGLNPPVNLDSTSTSFELLTTCRRLVPTDESVDLDLALSRSPSVDDPRPWLRIARRTRSPRMRAAGLHGAAMGLAASGRADQALKADMEAMVFGDRTAIAWNSIEHALLARANQRAEEYCARFRTDWEEFGDEQKAGYELAARSTRWLHLSTTSPRGYANVLRLLPPTLRQIAETNI